MTPRLRLFRLARGLSLDDLANAMGRIVTRQAIHLYEQGKTSPSPAVLTQMAKAMGIRAVDLCIPSTYEVELVAYRRYTGMRKGDSETIEAYLKAELERRAELQERCCADVPFEVPVSHYDVTTPEDAEQAAQDLRTKWRLGFDPIADLTMVLENHLVHVIEIKACPKFDGLSAIVRNAQGKLMATGVASGDDVPGDRQRLSLAHELGHLVMKVAHKEDEEKLAFRFAGAFLLPAPCVHREIGKHRTSLQTLELILMKKRFKVSVQAIVRRLYDLAIISEPTYKSAFTLISRLGWRKVEPEPISREKPEWSQQIASRGVAEKLLSPKEAKRLTGIEFEGALSTSLLRKTQFRALPPVERQKIIAREAAKLSSTKDSAWQSLDMEALLE